MSTIEMFHCISESCFNTSLFAIPFTLLLISNSSLPCQAKHATPGNSTWGVDGESGLIADMKELAVWDPLSVKVQTYKSAIEVCVCVCVCV